MNVSTLLRNAALAIAVPLIAATTITTSDFSSLAHVVGDVEVDVSDLDLAERSGLLILLLRIQDAALLSCDPTGQSRVLPYYGRPDSGDCYNDTLNAAIAEFASGPLTNIHDELKMSPIFVY